MDNFQQYLQFQKELTEAKLKLINCYLKGVDVKSVKSTSKIEVVENVLRIAGRPLHISELIKIAERDFKVNLERDSIASIMTKRIKAGRIFKRTAPNTFTLKE